MQWFGLTSSTLDMKEEDALGPMTKKRTTDTGMRREMAVWFSRGFSTTNAAPFVVFPLGCVVKAVAVTSLAPTGLVEAYQRLSPAD